MATTIFGTEGQGAVTYDFRCSCGTAGRLSIAVEEKGQIGCPDECGSSYIQWRYPDGRWALTCVVGVFTKRSRECGR